MRLIVLFDLLGEFCFLGAIDTTREYRLDVELAETHRYEIRVIGLDLGVVYRVVGVAAYTGVEHCHLALMFE